MNENTTVENVEDNTNNTNNANNNVNAPFNYEMLAKAILKEQNNQKTLEDKPILNVVQENVEKDKLINEKIELGRDQQKFYDNSVNLVSSINKDEPIYSKLVTEYENKSYPIDEKASRLLSDACTIFFSNAKNKQFIPSLSSHQQKVKDFLSIEEEVRYKKAKDMYEILALSLDKMQDHKKSKIASSVRNGVDIDNQLNYINKFLGIRKKLKNIKYNDGFNIEGV